MNGYAPNSYVQAGARGAVQRSEYNYDSGWVQNGQPQVVLAPDYPCAGPCQPARIAVTPSYGCGGGCASSPETHGGDRYGPPAGCCADGGGDDGYGGGYVESQGYDYHGFWKDKGPYRPVAHCGQPVPRGCAGGLRIPSSFFADGGGVGPDWIGGGGGGGGAVVIGGAGAGAGASAYASARASVHVSGGFRGHGGKGGHHGGGCCH